MMITPTHYMVLSAALFIIGVIGVMVRRNIIIIFMSIELILNAVNINLVAFSNELQNQVGQVFAIFVIAVAAAEAAVGLGIILAFYRNKETVNIDEMNLMRWGWQHEIHLVNPTAAGRRRRDQWARRHPLFFAQDGRPGRLRDDDA